MADVVDVPANGVAVLYIDRVISPKEAARIQTTWREHTGRECVLLSGGVRVAAVIADDPGTPIFDKMVASRRYRGLPSIERLAFGR